MPLKETAEYAIRLQLFFTAIGAVVAPTGTVTVSTPKLAVCTIARVAPKNTWLLAGIASKFAPVIVTVLPMKPVLGENELMIGALHCAISLGQANVHTNRKTDRILFMVSS
jgi:hypothetical protein